MLRKVRYVTGAGRSSSKCSNEEAVNPKRYNELVQLQIQGKVTRLKTIYIYDEEVEKWIVPAQYFRKRQDF